MKLQPGLPLCTVHTGTSSLLSRNDCHLEQECIPVGCVPLAAAAIRWGRGCLPGPLVWVWTPPRCGPGHHPLGLGLDSPLTKPPNLPLVSGPRNPPLDRPPQPPLGSGPRHPPSARPPNLPPGPRHPLCGQNDRQV